MKHFIILSLTAIMVFTPSLGLAVSCPQPDVQKDEISILNSMAGSKALLSKTGGHCWQTCSDNDYGKLNCTTTCDDGSSGKSSDGENIAASPLMIGLYCVILGVCVYWLIQSANAGSGL